jgi:TrmH family RNA methyltransferase
MPAQRLSKNQLKDLAKLKQKKYRIQQSQVVVEGERLVRQLIDNGVTLHQIIATSESELSSFPSHTPTFVLDADQMSRICSTQHPQSIAACVSTATIPITDERFLLYLDGIREPGNLGTIFRTATGAGVSGILLSPDCCELFNPKVIRASMGTVFSMPTAVEDHNRFLQRSSTRIVTCLQDAISLYQMPPLSSPVSVIIGNEAFGASQRLIDTADLKVTIPLAAGIESLNAAIATGIALFTIAHELNH